MIRDTPLARSGSGGVATGLDMGVALALGAARGYDARALAELLPPADAAVRALGQESQGAETEEMDA